MCIMILMLVAAHISSEFIVILSTVYVHTIIYIRATLYIYGDYIAI